MNPDQNDHRHAQIGRGIGIARIAFVAEEFLAVAQHVEPGREQQDENDGEEYFQFRPAPDDCRDDLHTITSRLEASPVLGNIPFWKRKRFPSTVSAT